MPTIEIDTRQIEILQDLLEAYPREARVALSNALNRTIDRTITFIHDEVSKEYAIKRIGVKRSLSTKRATSSNLQAEAISKGARLKVSNFPYTSSGKHRIAKVKIKQGGYVQSDSNPPMFVGRANKTTGKREVFKRTPNSPYKLGFGMTVSIPQMVANEDVFEHVAYKSELYLAERFEHELEQKFRRISGGL